MSKILQAKRVMDFVVKSGNVIHFGIGKTRICGKNRPLRIRRWYTYESVGRKAEEIEAGVKIRTRNNCLRSSCGRVDRKTNRSDPTMRVRWQIGGRVIRFGFVRRPVISGIGKRRRRKQKRNGPRRDGKSQLEKTIYGPCPFGVTIFHCRPVEIEIVAPRNDVGGHATLPYTSGRRRLEPGGGALTSPGSVGFSKTNTAWRETSRKRSGRFDTVFVRAFSSRVRPTTSSRWLGRFDENRSARRWRILKIDWGSMEIPPRSVFRGTIRTFTYANDNSHTIISK